MFRVFSSFFFLLVFFLIFGFFVYAFNIFLSTPGSSDQKVIFLISPGRSFPSVAQELIEKELVVISPFWLKLFGRFSGYANKIHVGEYELNRGMSLLEVFDVLSSGRSIEYFFTVREGLNMYEVADLLEEQNLGFASEFLKWCKDPKWIASLLGERLFSLEGYLFPDTYSLTKFTGEKNLTKIMVEQFKKVYAEVIQNSRLKMDRKKHIILASLIEKETGVNEERTLISSVFQNRLKKRMRLESDPTILYGILDEKRLRKKNITKQDILHKDRYNTYRIHGLPYGPIANPGRASLLAAINPASSDYLFFVSKNDGTHKFSKTYQEHKKAVHLYQISPHSLSSRYFSKQK